MTAKTKKRMIEETIKSISQASEEDINTVLERLSNDYEVNKVRKGTSKISLAG